MAEPARSSLALVAILRRHGITQEILELWVHVLESKLAGSVTFHHDPNGQVAKYELAMAGKVTAPVVETRLTKMFDSAIIVADCHSTE